MRMRPQMVLRGSLKNLVEECGAAAPGSTILGIAVPPVATTILLAAAVTLSVFV